MTIKQIAATVVVIIFLMLIGPILAAEFLTGAFHWITTFITHLGK